MQFQLQQAIRAIILFCFVVFLFDLNNSGDINQYINPKYEVLSQIGSLLFLLLFLVQLTRIWSRKRCSCCSHGHDHGNGSLSMKKVFFYSIILLPVLTGTFMPDVTLNSALAEKKGGMISLANSALGSQNKKTAPDPAAQKPDADFGAEQIPAEHYEPDPNVDLNLMEKDKYEQIMNELMNKKHIQFNDPLYASYYHKINENMEQFIGKKVSITGFVHKEEGFKHNQFVLSRFLITHCIADASLIGFLSELETGHVLEKDMWIEAEGIIETEEFDGVQMPSLKIMEWKEIEEPEQPYVYPVSMKSH